MKNLDTFNEFINEGVNDPGILKVFFMAGGPGSGKSYVASEIFGFPKQAVASVSYSTGLKLVNNDNAFETALKKAGLSAGELSKYAQDVDKWSEVMKIRDRAKGLTKRMQDAYIFGRLGQVIDGTGKNYDKLQGMRKLYQDLGYDTYMVFVNTSLEVALERNRNRERKLPDTIVEKMWKEVQANLGKFSRLFGKQNMIIIDNSSYEDSAKILAQIEKEIKRRVNKPVKNYLGKRWIQDQMNKDKNQPAGVSRKGWVGDAQFNESKED